MRNIYKGTMALGIILLIHCSSTITESTSYMDPSFTSDNKIVFLESYLKLKNKKNIFSGMFFGSPKVDRLEEHHSILMMDKDGSNETIIYSSDVDGFDNLIALPGNTKISFYNYNDKKYYIMDYNGTVISKFQINKTISVQDRIVDWSPDESMFVAVDDSILFFNSTGVFIKAINGEYPHWRYNNKLLFYENNSKLISQFDFNSNTYSDIDSLSSFFFLYTYDGQSIYYRSSIDSIYVHNITTGAESYLGPYRVSAEQYENQIDIAPDRSSYVYLEVGNINLYDIESNTSTVLRSSD